MREVSVDAPAKINLFLDILGKREDGYHELRTVMQTIDLYNHVRVGLTGTNDTYIFCNHDDIPCDERNLAWKAAQRFFEATGTPACGLNIALEKVIPAEAGLAGGSADAAATLAALDHLFGTGLSEEELCAIGVRVGADVPFCIRGGTVLAEGIGEKMTALSPLPECYILVAKPREGVRTEDCYGAIDRVGIKHHPDWEAMENALKERDLSEIGENLENVFEEVTNLESIAQIKKIMLERGATGACMTGSGSAVYGLFREKRQAKHCATRLKGSCRSVFLTHPVAHGALGGIL